MKRDFVVFLLISFFTLLFWREAFSNFFAQDDFIFIKHFSQNNLLIDVVNAVGKPEVTHWRPMHNLYFLISGNLFGKNAILYHLLTLVIHITAAFFVFKIGQRLIGNINAVVVGALFYAIHPAHFVSMFWISGGATTIGFMLLAISLWSFLSNKKFLSNIFFIPAMLASEAMFFGILIFAALMIFKKVDKDFKFLSILTLASLVFVLIKTFLTSAATFEIYKVEISTNVFYALRYYILRILGFAEISDDRFTSLGLIIFWSFLIFTVGKSFLKNLKQLILPVAVIIAGLFPFVLIPSHLSPHYMNISIWGLSIVLAFALKNLEMINSLVLLLIFASVSLINVAKIEQNNWVVKRSNLAKELVLNVQREDPIAGSIIVFEDSKLASSLEKYVTLGGGSAIDLWFGDKNYKKCFSFLENCPKDSYYYF